MEQAIPRGYFGNIVKFDAWGHRFELDFLDTALVRGLPITKKWRRFGYIIRTSLCYFCLWLGRGLTLRTPLFGLSFPQQNGSVFWLGLFPNFRVFRIENDGDLLYLFNWYSRRK